VKVKHKFGLRLIFNQISVIRIFVTKNTYSGYELC
jgi:hypothetical protein